MEWISSKDRLPDIMDNYLVVRSYPLGNQEIIISLFKPEHQIFDDIMFDIITHWMPLPPPPTENK